MTSLKKSSQNTPESTVSQIVSAMVERLCDPVIGKQLAENAARFDARLSKVRKVDPALLKRPVTF